MQSLIHISNQKTMTFLFLLRCALLLCAMYVECAFHWPTLHIGGLASDMKCDYGCVKQELRLVGLFRHRSKPFHEAMLVLLQSIG